MQWHAKARMIAGANAFIVGRDPAGISHPDKEVNPGRDLYDPTDSGTLLKIAPGLKDLRIIDFKMAAYNKVLKKMDYFEPARMDEFEFITGTKMRSKIRYIPSR